MIRIMYVWELVCNFYCGAQCSALLLWLWIPFFIFKALSLCKFITTFQLVITARSVSSLAVFTYWTSDWQNILVVLKFASIVVALFNPVAIGKLCHPKHYVAISAKKWPFLVWRECSWLPLWPPQQRQMLW